MPTDSPRRRLSVADGPVVGGRVVDGARVVYPAAITAITLAYLTRRPGAALIVRRAGDRGPSQDGRTVHEPAGVAVGGTERLSVPYSCAGQTTLAG